MGSDNKVLDGTIHCRTGMKITIGIWWTIVQNEGWFSFMVLQNVLLIVVVLPLFQDLRFLCRQISSHFEICHRQVQRFFVIHVFAPLFSIKNVLEIIL